LVTFIGAEKIIRSAEVTAMFTVKNQDVLFDGVFFMYYFQFDFDE